MWHAKTSDEKCPEKKIRHRCQLTAAALILLDVAVPSPSSHGWILAGLANSIHQLIPAGFPSLTAAGLVLAACYRLFRSPPRHAPGLQHEMNDAADMKRGDGRLGDLGDMPEIELQPAGQPAVQPGGGHGFPQSLDDADLGAWLCRRLNLHRIGRGNHRPPAFYQPSNSI
jgi:hypothetical protein